MFLHCWRKQFQAMGQGDALAVIEAHNSGPDVWPLYRLLTSPSASLPSILCSVMPGLPTPQLFLSNCSSVPLTGAAVVMNSTPPGPWAPYPYGVIPPHCNMALQVSPEPPFPDEELGFCKACYLPRAMWPWTHGWLRPCYYHNTCVSSPSFCLVIAKTSVSSSVIFNDTE